MQEAQAAGRDLGAQEVFHQAVLERVEGDDRQPAAGGEGFDRLRQHRLDLAELVVGGDAQGLEDARRVAAGAPAGVRRQRLLDGGEQLAAGLDRLVAAAGDAERPDLDAAALWARTLDEVAGPWQHAATIDPRVAQAQDLIKRSFPSAPSVAALAAAVGLSASRLIHLWKDEVGISLRRYVLWLRLRHVIARITIGDSLTDAAHDAGFADSAHLSRTFSSMFGLPLSRLFGPAARVRLLLKLPDAELSGPHGPYDRPRWDAAAQRLRRKL